MEYLSFASSAPWKQNILECQLLRKGKKVHRALKWVSKVIWDCFGLNFAFWLVKKTLQSSQPIRFKINNNCVFPRFKQFVFFHFEFSLANDNVISCWYWFSFRSSSRSRSFSRSVSPRTPQTRSPVVRAAKPGPHPRRVDSRREREKERPDRSHERERERDRTRFVMNFSSQVKNLYSVLI